MTMMLFVNCSVHDSVITVVVSVVGGWYLSVPRCPGLVRYAGCIRKRSGYLGPFLLDAKKRS